MAPLKFSIVAVTPTAIPGTPEKLTRSTQRNRQGKERLLRRGCRRAAASNLPVSTASAELEVRDRSLFSTLPFSREWARVIREPG